jgi:hypothetical protein
MSTPESTTYDTDPNARNYDSGNGNETKTRPLNALRTDADTQDEEAEPSYLHQEAKTEMNTRWKEVQTEFVDDPRKSVAHAHQLVSDAVQRIVDTFTQERNQLERQWSEGGDVSTEDLRVCLQRYREFFTRLLPLDARP